MPAAGAPTPGRGSGPRAWTRRSLLGSVAAAGLGWAAGCGGPATSSGRPRRERDVERLFYGSDHDQQLLDVRRPSTARGTDALTVVLLHGGYWQSSYGLDLMVPMAERLTSRGHTTANVEYRRVGSGGGWPTTFEDVAAALDLVARRTGTGPDDLPRRVVVVGHSAGGHLAAWTASRTARTPGGAPAGRLGRVVSLAGLLDLTSAASAPESGGAVVSLVGGTPREHPDRYRLADPALLVPAPCPVWAVQDADERVVPTDQAARYVRAARRAGGEARSLTVPGDHFTLIDPTADSWPRLERLVTGGR